MSGKGGVGKSTVTALLAGAMAKKGYRVGILDADITGPSIPRLFGLKGGRLQTGPRGLVPMETTLGIRVMSLNLLVEQEDEAVIWRGPILAGAVRQFWEEVDWGELDYLFVDLPPGTGDVPLTVLQSLPLSGVIIVMSPQDLAVMIVKKAAHMTQQLDVPIIGLIENMAYHECQGCGEVSYPFGKPQGEQVSAALGVPLLATLPIKQAITSFGDRGQIEMLDEGPLSEAAVHIENLRAASSGQGLEGRQFN
jgi:Mrp family chromosome partitioning ATPase